ncbi:(R)-mandelonitrile lyase [Novosphingobium soli]|uniref:Cupin domain-containing protein n=1 Tax=Novosphingobium soli TaxID=574956 RepID=A0ABV6CZC6_9SPHN
MRSARHRLSLAALAAAWLLIGPAHAAGPEPASPSNHKERIMKLYRNGSRPSQRGPAEWFTGAVRLDPLNSPEGPARTGSARVTFEPGARTAWHTHPLGQTLIVTEGVGWTQCEGGPIVELRAGDVVWCPPGHRHWHGATATTAMTHIAIQEALDGKMVEWMEHVTDAEYLAGPAQD